jgi:hypothetical protein
MAENENIRFVMLKFGSWMLKYARKFGYIYYKPW